MEKLYNNPYSKDNPNAIKDWFKVLSTSYDDMGTELMHKLISASGSWQICACSNLSIDIPRNRFGRPLDIKLYCLGMILEENIRDMGYELQCGNSEAYGFTQKAVIITYRRIELRATEILKEMGIIN